MLNTKKGIYLSLITALVSGVSIFVNKFAVGAITPALYFTSVKNFSVALLITAIVLFTGKFREITKLSKKEIFYLILVGIIGGALPFYLYFTGLSQTSAINAALIHKTLVFWVMLMAVPILKEKVTKGQFMGVITLFAANLMVGGFKSFAVSQGEFMILIATVLWAVENIIAKKVLATVSAGIVAFFRMSVGSIILMTVTFLSVPDIATKSISMSGGQFIWLAVTILFLLAYTLTWYSSLKLAPAVVVTSVLVSSTLVTNALTAVFLTHNWNVELTAQTVLMITGLWIFNRFSNLKVEEKAVLSN